MVDTKREEENLNYLTRHASKLVTSTTKTTTTTSHVFSFIIIFRHSLRHAIIRVLHVQLHSRSSDAFGAYFSFWLLGKNNKILKNLIFFINYKAITIRKIVEVTSFFSSFFGFKGRMLHRCEI